MSLENKVNITLNHLKGFKSRLASNVKRAAYVGLISLALAGVAKSTENNPSINPNKDYSWVGPQDNLQNELIASPELGYVIKTENETDINLLNNMLSSSGNTDIKQIGGAGHKNLSIVNNNNAAENEKTIQALKNYSQVRYAAPLFSANGETVAVIPEIVARVKGEADYSKLEELCNSSNLRIKKKMDFTKKEYLIDVLGNDANAVFESVNTLNNTKFIEWASPNLAFQPKLCNEQEPGQFIPNDELFPRQWHLNNTGQSGGTPNADINAPEAWAVLGGGGDPNITIAVLDTGVDYNHPDLFDNIWVNKNIVQDTNSNGKIDIHDLDLNNNNSLEENELNFYGEDEGVIGWDSVDNDSSPSPSLDHPFNAHGTAVAGLAAARGNNNLGVTGVAYDCKIMPIRITGIDNNGITNFSTWADVATAFRWAAENDADVINCSWGTGFGISIIHSAVKDSTVLRGIGRRGKGCIISASSGNYNLFGLGISFPAKYPEVIAVGAMDHNGGIYSYSVHGPELEVVAPSGFVNFNWNGNFWTTDISGDLGLNNPYLNISQDYTNRMGGTSGACPIASGVAALVLSRNYDLTNNEVRRILSRSARDLGPQGWDKDYGNGCVNAYAAVKMALNPPEPFLFVDDDAINDPGKENPEISDSLEDGSIEHPFDSIQEAINSAVAGDSVIVLPGVYIGKGNYDIEFLRKAITVRSRDGPSDCIIDCQSLGRGFYFRKGEEKNSKLEGFTITNGNTDYGAGIRCVLDSNPTIMNCILANNMANYYGGGFENSFSNPALINCTITGNSAKYGGGISSFSGTHGNLELINCIITGNEPEEVYLDGWALRIIYSNGGWSGLGNIDTNPLFADPANGDFHLKSRAGRWDPKSQTWVKDEVTSPCIDAGNPGSPLENELLSIPGRPNEEVYNSRINMGAYGGTAEASFPEDNWTLLPDLTNNGKVNFEDFAVFSKYWRKTGNNLPADLNRDGKVDAADLTWLTGDWLIETEQYKPEP